MARHDYKTEPAHLKRTWHENKGNWLLATAIVVSCLAWVVGYFQLIPEITPNRRVVTRSLLSTGHTLIVHISGCESDEGQVVAMLYDAEQYTPNSVAQRVQTLEIDQQKTVWPIHNLHFGSYAILAYHDVNANEMLDVETERQGIAVDPTAQNVQSAIAPADNTQSSGKLKAAFQFYESNKVVFVELQ